MAGAGGLANILLGGLIGFVFAIVAIVLVIYCLRTSHPRRGFNASMTALVLSVLSVLLSAPIWDVMLSGRGTHGEPIDYGEASPAVILVVFEAISALISGLCAVREALRRLS